MEMMKLKNGQEEAKPLVAATMCSLRELLEADPMAFYDLVMLCRDRQYQPFGNTIERLEKWNLVQQGKIHESIRNILLSAVVGDGLDMEIVNPIAQKEI